MLDSDQGQARKHERGGSFRQVLREGLTRQVGIFQAEETAGAKPRVQSAQPVGGTGKKPTEWDGEKEGRES